LSTAATSIEPSPYPFSATWQVKRNEGKSTTAGGKKRPLPVRQKSQGDVGLPDSDCFCHLPGPLGGSQFEPFASTRLGGYQLKLAFLYNFAKFVEWPPGAFPQSNAPVFVGIVGHDPFTIDMEEQVCGRSANGHPILLKRLRPGDALRGCHIIFISAAENKNLPAILANLKGASVLTVGETDTFATNGGVIRFFVENNTLHFEINPDVAAQTGLRISSRLLALAKIVRNAAADEKPSAESKSPRGRIQR
jgi:hypothetical protein